MEEQLRSILLASSGVAALCADRINWGSHPQGVTGPYIVLWTVSDFQEHTLDGPDGLSRGRVQADCYAATYGQAKQVSRAVRAVLDGYSGNGFQGVFLAGAQDSTEDSGTARIYRVRMDFTTNFNPT